MKYFLFVYAALLFVSPLWAETQTEDERYPVSLFELAPQISFLQTSTPINGVQTPFTSNANPGAILRFTPIWRNKYPLFIHFGGVQLTEQNNAGVTVNGEHGNVKYVWTFGTRVGLPLFSRFTLTTGMEFNHEPFMRDEGTGTSLFLNKVLIPTLPIGLLVEWWRDENLSATLDLGFKAYFSVPMDLYMLRNGSVVYIRTGARYRMDDLQLLANLFFENRYINTSIASVSMQNFGLEIGVGWSYGK